MAKRKKELKFFWETQKSDFFEEPFEFSMPAETKLQQIIPVHVAETEREVIVRAQIPGFKKNDVNLNVTESHVEIAAAKKMERVERTAGSLTHERQAGALRRAFMLPAKVDPDRAEATLENGLLTIRMPKLFPEQKKKRRIDVK